MNISEESNTPQPLWNPSPSTVLNTRLKDFMDWLKQYKSLEFNDYDQLWEWSVSDIASFWEYLCQYFDVSFHTPYRYIISEDPMPHTKWFEDGTLNYAEHIFRHTSPSRPAIIYFAEEKELKEISWQTLTSSVKACVAYLRSVGVKKGDRIVAYVPNIPQATIAFLATCAIGAIWSSCSPDFGVDSVVERFQQIGPSVLIAVDGYPYKGKKYNKVAEVRKIVDKLPTLQRIIGISYIDENSSFINGITTHWDEVMSFPVSKDPLAFELVPFDHPIWVLFSSGTTGHPKAITHSHGGVLLEHLKYLAFHNDVHEGEKFFWFTTTGWMMWNFVHAALLVGATIVLYDGHPAYPDLNVLWKMAQDISLEHFGTGAPYLISCMKKHLSPSTSFRLNKLRSLSSTGSPLPPEAFEWVYQHVKEDIWLCSMSGGTDVCTAFVGGVPTEPVFQGEIQRRGLGCAMFAYDDLGKKLVDEVGEMVITQPMPSMPIFFWNDEQKARYISSYFDVYPGVWRHGDWVKITSRNTLIILGRSDATLNRHGIRIGTAEIYRALNNIPQIEDSLIVNLEISGGQHFMPLFVVLKEGIKVDEPIKKKIQKILMETYSPRHVPDEIYQIKEIPYTISGKKLEAPVKKILLGIPVEKSANKGALRNPASLDVFMQMRAQFLDEGKIS